MFTHLHTHSFFSFSRGTIPAEKLPQLALDRGMRAVALTDTNNMSGALEFYLAAKKAGIKPILGVELMTRTERAVLLARSAEGYAEICRTVTAVLEAIPQTKPKLTLEELIENKPKEIPEEKRGVPLWSMLTALSSEIIVLSSTPVILNELAARGKKDLYIELIPSERRSWPLLREVYRDTKLPFIATNNVLMADRSDHALHRMLRAIGTNTATTTLPEYEVGHDSQYFTTEAELRRMLGNVGEEAFANVRRVEESIDIELDLKKAKFATFPHEDPFRMLRDLSEQGFRDKYARPTLEHHARFEFELKTIADLNATSYYLAVHDMIEYAKRQNFPFLGRGSGANSLIAYCLGVTNVDPIAHHLRFERFLNPEREMPPDFDIDFSWKDRYDVIHYMLNRFGSENSAMLCTVQCYRDRGAVREVGKALGYPDAEINRLIASNRQTVRTGIATTRSTEDIRDWLTWAERLNGFPRHLSVHAGGILIADKAITHYTPVQIAPIGVPITQQDMFSADEWKLIKLDILATRGLGTYWDTLRHVEERHGVRPAVEHDVTIAFNDEPTKEMIRTGRSKGCFYIESPAMISLLRKLRTDTFENLTAASSVIRPGVAQSGMMDEFIKRHHDPSRRDHIHPRMGELMADTYGVMVYQEDVLTVAHELAGLSYGEADLMRRAMSGKTRSHERMSDLREKFIEGCISNDITRAVAEEIWRQIASFSGYSFCKAHSASYAVLSFQEAWLKVHYPAEFISSVLNNYGGFYRHQEYINEAKLLGIAVRVPNVNESQRHHFVNAKGEIQLGFDALKEVSVRSIDALLESRDAMGPFTSIDDFTERSGVTPEDGRILISIGACDALGEARPSLLFKFDTRMKASFKDSRFSPGLGFPHEEFRWDLSHLHEYSHGYRFQLERRYLGYSVTNHPMELLQSHRTTTHDSSNLAQHVNRTVTVVGHIAATKTVRTRKGDIMLMLNLGDEYGMIDVVIWPEQYQKYYTQFSSAEALRIKGKVTQSFNTFALVAEVVERIDFREMTEDSKGVINPNSRTSTTPPPSRNSKRDVGERVVASGT